MLVLILAAAWLRLWQLSETPPGLWWDEAYNAMDAVWMAHTGMPEIFFIGNNGREPLHLYLGALSMSLLGASPFTFRFAAAIVGTLTIPITFLWLKKFFVYHPDRYWLALFTTAGFCFSLWHIAMSRSGYRAILIPAFFMITIYLFWEGWQKRSLLYFALAGVSLGLSQYTYVLARLLPLVFGIYAIAWTVVGRKQREPSVQSSPGENNTNSVAYTSKNDTRWFKLSLENSATVTLWMGLLVTALVSAIVFLPLGIFFFQNPSAFFSSTKAASDTELLSTSSYLSALLDSFMRTFVIGYDHNWRHGVVGRNGFGYVEMVGFWLGLFATIKQFRRPTHLFLLISLLALWLPVSFSDRVHMLRLSALMPVYYAIMAVGFVSLSHFISHRLQQIPTDIWLKPMVLVFVVLISGGLTYYDYFVRWAHEPLVYQEFDGPTADLARELVEKSKEVDILIPFPFYALPTTRLILYDKFQEREIPENFHPNRSSLFVTVPDQKLNPRISRVKDAAYVWLTYDQTGQGVAYVSRHYWPEPELLASSIVDNAMPFTNPATGEAVAHFIPIPDAEPIVSLFTTWSPFLPVDYVFENRLHLIGYQTYPNVVQPGHTLILDLYWKIETVVPRNNSLSIEILNPQGTIIHQLENSLEGMLRWRQNTTVRLQQLLFIGPETSSGPYLIQIRLFDSSGQPVPGYAPDTNLFEEKIIAGIFYVGEENADPRHPPVSITAKVTDTLELIGYAPPVPLTDRLFRGKLYWRSTKPITNDFGMFVQLLDAHQQPITSWQARPLLGNYPTFQWQPNEIVVDEFDLRLPSNLKPGDYYLMAGIFDSSTISELPDSGALEWSQFGNVITLTQSTLP
ncbi:MAG: glycosyltransferase family 39 protein [Anaerolineae bacterium]|nr:glycosyltransferase family 39 protein [Anaerolineae bacterium]